MRLFRFTLLVACLTALWACNINTMYNAQRYFQSAQERPLNTNGKPNNQAIEDYTKTIKKCGIILSASKKGPHVDDALFLMAKALYFKGNSAFQAKDQFENLILGFPKSPFVPESHLFVAKIFREINQPKDAERRLDEFIRNPAFRKKHPEALLLLTDFAIRDKDYIKAQYWLERIIRDYPKTKEFKTAYFLFGKNYFEQREFQASLDAFEKMSGARGIDKALKLDTRYYIGLNLLELGELDKAYKTANSLLKAETRLDKLAPARLLKARILFAKGNNEDAKKEIEFINKTYPRTESSAAAMYYLAEFQYYTLGDVTNAAINYNKVRTEFTTSPLASISQAKATAVTNVAPKANMNSETATKQFLDYKYLAAESFLSTLALPDSALACYRSVIRERDVLATRRDSLQLEVDTLSVVLDSMRLEKDLLTEETAITPNSSLTEADENLVAVISDSLSSTPDSLAIADLQDKESTPEDSLATKERDRIAAAAERKRELLVQIRQTESQLTALQGRITRIGEIIEQFDTETIPFCMFAMGSVLNDHFPERPDNAQLYSNMLENYPNSKYTRALNSLQKGQTVRLIDPLEESQEQLMDKLFGMVSTAPDSALAGLGEMLQSPYSRFKLAANFRLGWYYSFENSDTTRAKPYLKFVLDDTNAGDYASLTRRFFDGNKFLVWDKVALDSLVVQDSLFAPDSLLQEAVSTNPADSTIILEKTKPEEPVIELPPELQEPAKSEAESSPLKKEEEIPQE